MYEHFFAALVDIIKAALGDEWQPDIADAWNTRIEDIMAQVRVHPAVA